MVMKLRLCILTLTFYSLALAAYAQPPKAPPPLPAIAPGQARLVETLGGKDGPCYVLAARDGAENLIVGGETGALVSWPRSAWMSIRVGQTAPDVAQSHDGPITALAWSNNWLASAGADRKVKLWAMPGRELKQTLDSADNVRALALSPDDKILAVGDDTNSIRLIDAASGKETGKLNGHSDWILCLSFSPDGTRLASGSYDGHMIIWDLAAKKKVAENPVRLPPVPLYYIPRPAIAVTSIAFRGDSKMIAVGLANGMINLHNPADGKILRSLQQNGHTSVVTSLAFHPSGTVLASGGKDRSVKLWNPDNGQLLINLDGHTSWVEGLAFLEKGTRLASASADQTVRIWDLTAKK
jgi:WD40 repeat protein